MMSGTEKKYPVKVSVVLPTYNQAAYLPALLQNLLTQTMADFELIVVNDGSTDQTAQILAGVQHPQLHVVTQDNQGLPSALNKGFSVARGEYWTWTSTDNLVSPNWLSELVQALDQCPADVGYVFSSYALINDAGQVIHINNDPRFDIPTMLMSHPGNASFLYRAELAKKVGPYDTALCYAEDLDMWVRMAEVTRAVHVESVLYYYRTHANSMTAQRDKVKNATTGVVNKFLAKTAGVFDIDRLFPSIAESADPMFERWKARVRLATLGVNANYYCPVDALVDQLIKALHEKYDAGLVANIVHLFAKESRWAQASHVVEACRQQDPSDLLKRLADIVSRQSLAELQQVPFFALEEKMLASDCRGSLSQKELLRNLSSLTENSQVDSPVSFEGLARGLIGMLEDPKSYPEVWRQIAAMQSPDEKNMLNHLRLYLTQLTSIAQEQATMVLILPLEAMCLAYTDNVQVAKLRLGSLIKQRPDCQAAISALAYIENDALLANERVASTV